VAGSAGVAACALGAAACGSVSTSELPPAAGPASSPPLAAAPAGRVIPVGDAPRGLRLAPQPPAVARADGGRKLAVLSPRERELELLDAATRRRVGAAAAGTGPTHVVGDGGNYLYVADTKAGALLVFRILPELHLTRRYPLPGSPYGLAFDRARGRIWATLAATNELVELSAGARPRVLRRFAAVRQPDSVVVEPGSGRVLVTGKADGVLQVLDPPRAR
jgi:DNA-binding beta-propeller fold protein YncE